MTWDQLHANWKEFAGSARAHWGNLTDDDWKTIAGKREHFGVRVQHRYGIANQAAERQGEEGSPPLAQFAHLPRGH